MDNIKNTAETRAGDKRANRGFRAAGKVLVARLKIVRGARSKKKEMETQAAR